MTRGLLTREESAALRRVLAMLDLDRRRAALAVAAGSAGLGSAVALIAVSGWLIARASQMPPVLDLTVAVVSVRAFGIARAAFRYLERLASHDVALRGVAALRERLYELLAAARTDTLVSLRRGEVLARTGADVDAVGDVVVRGLLPAGVAAVVSAVAVGIVAAILPAAGLVLLVSLLLAGVLAPALTARAVRVSERAALTERGTISAVALTATDSAAELTVSGRTPALLAELDRAEARLATAADSAARPAAAAAGVNLAAMGLALLGTLAIGIPATTAGTLAPVELAVIALVPLAAFEATGMLPLAASQVLRSAAAARRITDLLGEAPPAGPGTSSTAVSGSPTSTSSATGADDTSTPPLAAADLGCGWADGPVVLTGVDLTVRPGDAVAVVGPSGTGKTTLLLTLGGLLPAREGAVRLDGRDPWLLERAEVSRSLVVTAEDAHLFATSVLENLRVARGNVSPEEAEEVLGRVGLGAWLAELPAGLETPLGADGATVSGGERRRLLLARALLSPAKVLLVDEPGEHLDPASADALLADLVRAAREAGRAVVVVTHRLTPLAGLTDVLLLGHDGPGPARVVARGRHEDLVASVPGYAWALAQEQTGSLGDTVTPGRAETEQGAAP